MPEAREEPWKLGCTVAPAVGVGGAVSARGGAAARALQSTGGPAVHPWPAGQERPRGDSGQEALGAHGTQAVNQPCVC